MTTSPSVTLSSPSQSSDTLRAIFLMVVSMAAFATADMFIKVSSTALPGSQVLTALGIGGTLLFGTITKLQGIPLFTKQIAHPAILARGICEIIATGGFLMALTLLPFSTASSILQVTPLLVTLGAALFLKESVSWRRWSAIIAGFSGVLIILNPMAGADAAPQTTLFSGGALLAIIGVFGLAGRDLATRYIPKNVRNVQAATWGFATVIVAGLLLSLFGDGWQTPTTLGWLYLIGLVAFAGIGYFAITAAMRIGDVSAVAPFRYTRIIFAFALSILIFGETLTTQTLLGATLIIAAGLYVWLRERKINQSLQPDTTTR